MFRCISRVIGYQAIATMANVTGDFVAGTVVAQLGVVEDAPAPGSVEGVDDIAETVEESASSADG